MKNKRKIIFLRGIQGSGKSTYCREKMKKDSSFVCISRDDIRFTLYGDTYYSGNVQYKEKVVTKIFKSNLRLSILSGYNVILDEMNISPKYLSTTISYIKYICKVGLCEPVFEVVDFLDKPLKECIANNANRVGTTGYVPVDVIKKTHQKALSANKEWYKRFALLTSQDAPMKIEQDELKQKAVIFDIDGTLALMDDRDPYDEDQYEMDSLNEYVYNIYSEFRKNPEYKILVVTGRRGTPTGIKNTISWLQSYGINYDEIHFRPENNPTQPDSVVKEKIWRDIITRYYIDFMIDDRTQVVEHARLCGFNVLQTTFGDF